MRLKEQGVLEGRRIHKHDTRKTTQRMTRSRTKLTLRTAVFCATMATGKQAAAETVNNALSGGGQPPVLKIWNEEIPVMCSLAVAMDGTVLLFKEQRDEKLMVSP